MTQAALAAAPTPAREVFDHLCALHAAAYDHDCQECIGHAGALLDAWNEGLLVVVGPEIDLLGRPV